MKNHKKTGFTLVETLVAISILSISIAAAFTAVQGGIQSSIVARDQITAFYLAQEGMEFIKNLRDENAIHSVAGQSTNWLHSIAELANDPCFFGKTCQADAPLKTLSQCIGTCPYLNEDSSSGLFGYTGSWPQSKFRRDIQIVSVNANEVTVLVTMMWMDGQNQHFFQVSGELFNRQ